LADEQKPIVKLRTRYKKGEKTVVPAFAGMELVVARIIRSKYGFLGGIRLTANDWNTLQYCTVPVPVVIVLLVAGHETAPAM
jgi:hypothetical protein